MPAATTTGQRYAKLVSGFLRRPAVTQEGKGFGSSALRVHGKIFALLSTRQEFVVKLSRRRVDELVSAGDGQAFEPGWGRRMKEWLALRPSSKQDWTSLAAEAMEFVASSATKTSPSTRDAPRRRP